MRQRLLDRRDVETTTLAFRRSDGSSTHFEASIGFDAQGKPKEIFLCGAKSGSDLDAMLNDTAVAISVALQHDVPAKAMAASVARIPEEIDGPGLLPASIVGAVLDLVASYEETGGEG